MKKGLFALSESKKASIKKEETWKPSETKGIEVHNIRKDYQKLGMVEAGKSRGETVSFKLWLKRAFVMAVRDNRIILGLENKRLIDLKQEIIHLKGQQEKQVDKRVHLLEKVDEHEETIIRLQDEVESIKGGEKVDPNQLDVKVDPVAFVMGCLILVALTAYLVIFYTSVIYSAFIYDVKAVLMDNLKSGNLFLPTIINLKAIPNTHAQYGWIGSVFLVVSTSMFLALGYLIHKFGETKQHLKVAFLLIFTLLFDAFLAYQIVEEINIAKYEIGALEVPWTFNMVWSQVPFYIIIAAGFAVYIIWGLVLSFVLKEKEKLSPKKVAIREKSRGVRELKTEIDVLKEAINTADDEILSIRTTWRSKEEELNKQEYDPNFVRGCINAFSIGWNEFLNQVYSAEERDSRCEETIEIVDQFINNLPGRINS